MTYVLFQIIKHGRPKEMCRNEIDAAQISRGGEYVDCRYRSSKYLIMVYFEKRCMVRKSGISLVTSMLLQVNIYDI